MQITQYSVWWVDLNPTKGSEQKGKRPCVVVSPDVINRKLPIAIVVPLTTKQKKYPTVVEIKSTLPKTGSLSYALVEQIRNVSIVRFDSYICDLNPNEIDRLRGVIEDLLLG